MTLTYEDAEQCAKKQGLGMRYAISGNMWSPMWSHHLFIRKWGSIPHDIASVWIDNHTNSFEIYIHDERYKGDIQSFVSCLNMSGHKAGIVI